MFKSNYYYFVPWKPMPITIGFMTWVKGCSPFHKTQEKRGKRQAQQNSKKDEMEELRKHNVTN